MSPGVGGRRLAWFAITAVLVVAGSSCSIDAEGAPRDIDVRDQGDLRVNFDQAAGAATGSGRIYLLSPEVIGLTEALAELRRVSGPELLAAFVLGFEIECRVGAAVSPGHYPKGWHITSTCGVFAAAAAAGKLLGLGVQPMVWALGTAATQSAGMTCSDFHLPPRR